MVVQHLGWTIEIGALGIRAEIDAMAAQGGVVDPPTRDAVYWLSAYGTPSPTASNTVYLVGHSWSGGDAIFNPLTDPRSEQGMIPAGTSIVITTRSGELHYVVDSSARYPKDELADASEVWAIAPGRLVLITCFLHEGTGRSPDNFVVFAHLETSGS